MTNSNIAIYFVDVWIKCLIYILFFPTDFFLIINLALFLLFLYEAFLRQFFTIYTTFIFFPSLPLFRPERNSRDNSFTDTIFSFLKPSWLSKSYFIQSLRYQGGLENILHEVRTILNTIYLTCRRRKSRRKDLVRNFTLYLMPHLI